MSAPQKFRSAFNGFNREDVAGYLEYLTAKHTSQVNQLTAELEHLRSRLEDAQAPVAPQTVSVPDPEAAGLRAQLAEQQSQYDTLLERCTELEAQQQEHDTLRQYCARLEARLEEQDAPCQRCSQLEALQEECETLRRRCAQLEAQPAPAAPQCNPAEELEIYRRAERTERMARERADLIYRQANGVLNTAALRVNEMSQQVVPMADAILTQLGQLQETVSTTRQSLQEASIVLSSLRSDNN